MKAQIVPARLDSDRSAKPLTTLTKHFPADGRCVGPASLPLYMTLKDNVSGDTYTLTPAAEKGVSHIALVGGMFGSEFRNTSHHFGLSCGQTRPTTHNCAGCGFNKDWGTKVAGPMTENYLDWRGQRPDYLVAYCECRTISHTCEKMGHNNSWYNQDGHKMGWGDICSCDIARIAQEADPSHTFYLLYEGAFWDFVKKIGSFGWDATVDRSIEAPGLDYIKREAHTFIRGGKVYGVVRDEDTDRIGQTWQRGAVTGIYIGRGSL